MMILFKLMEALWPIAYLAGLVVTILYFRKHGKPVFILLLVYFAMGIYSCTLARHVERLFWPKTAAITPEQMEKYEAYQKDIEDLHIRHFGAVQGATTASVRRVSFPFGQIILVVTLVLLGKRMESKLPNTAEHGTGCARP